MLEKGFTIKEAMSFLMVHLPGIKKKQAAAVQSKLQEGVPLHELLPLLHVPPLICLQVFFAEEHGDVPTTLIHAGTRWMETEQSKEKLVKLLQYPAFLLVLLLALLAILNTVVLPQFRDLHETMGYTPGGFIAFLLFCLQWGPLILLILIPSIMAVAAVFLLNMRRASPSHQANTLIRFPLVRSLFRLSFTCLFAREAGYMLHSGFAVNDMLTIFERQTIYPMLHAASVRLNDRLLQGDSLPEAIEHIPWFDRNLPLLIRHGSANSKTGEELILYAELCEEHIREKITSATAVIQPVVFVSIGVVVMSVYLAVMLPMFQMMSTI